MIAEYGLQIAESLVDCFDLIQQSAIRNLHLSQGVRHGW